MLQNFQDQLFKLQMNSFLQCHSQQQVTDMFWKTFWYNLAENDSPLSIKVWLFKLQSWWRWRVRIDFIYNFTFTFIKTRWFCMYFTEVLWVLSEIRMLIRCWNQYQSNNTQISQIGYFRTLTVKATLISVHVSSFLLRLKMKLSKLGYCDSTK